MFSSYLVTLLVFIIASTLIAYFGVKMTYVARDIAHSTGMGEALMGALFIGASTSLSGITASITAASQGHAALAVSNSLGGIAAQTMFLAIADMVYRKANLEHAAASAENLMMTAFLILLLAILLLNFNIPDISFLHIHPGTFILLAAYIVGVHLLARTHRMPMWLPRQTRETRKEKSASKGSRGTPHSWLWSQFLIYSAIVTVCGWALGHSGITIAEEHGLSEGLIGGVFIAISTSLPELIIAITAVRLGALTLAVGDIIGGNTFDTLFIAMSDIAYVEGSIYSSITSIEHVWLALCLLMTSILLMGLLHRERYGIANIGLESALVFIIYVSGLIYIAY